MQGKIIWQQASSNAENSNHLAAISQWWSNLNGQEVEWRQRLLPQSGNMEELNWEAQRFDEIFELKNPQIRGITLYWYKPGVEQERSTTPHQLVLNTRCQQLYIFPQSQKQLVIRIGLPEIPYQTLELQNPQLDCIFDGTNHVIIWRDGQQQLEVKVTLSPENFNQLKQQLS